MLQQPFEFYVVDNYMCRYICKYVRICTKWWKNGPNDNIAVNRLHYRFRQILTFFTEHTLSLLPPSLT